MNIVKELLELKQKVHKLYCLIGESTGIVTYKEKDPTVPDFVKAITEEDISNWNNTNDTEVNITVETNYAAIDENQAIFNENIAKAVDDIKDNLQIEFDLTTK